MEQIEPEIFQIAKPDDDDKEEEPKLTREELIQRSRELRQLRIKESQRSVKAHHQNKIKSKKYHRIMKKEKMKQQIKEFELLQKTDPEAALRKIEQLDKSRIEERANLRHRNTGTWAKNLQVRAKYDKDARKDLAEQIAISRELTAKKNAEDSDDDDLDADGVEAFDRDADPFNPWIKAGKTNGSTETGVVDEFMSGYRKYWQERNDKQKELAEYVAKEVPEKDDAVQSDVDKQIEETISIKNAQTKGSGEKTKIVNKQKIKSKSKSAKESKLNAGWLEEDILDVSVASSKKVKSAEKLGKKEKKPKKSKTKEKKSQVVDNIDDLFDEAEDVLRVKSEKIYDKLKTDLSSKKFSKNRRTGNDERENESERIDLSFKKQIKRPELDEELNGGDDAGPENSLSNQITKTLNSIKSNGHSDTQTNDKLNTYESENINPNDIAKVKSHHLSTALPDTVYSVADDGFNEYDDDYHFDDEKKLTIAEAFEDDDVVAEFKQEKDEEAKKNEPQEIDLSLPGWGSWGGTGIDPTKRRTKRKLVLRTLILLLLLSK